MLGKFVKYLLSDTILFFFFHSFNDSLIKFLETERLLSPETGKETKAWREKAN